MVASAVQVPLKVKTDTKFFQFMEWYETFYTTTNPDTGRKRKGNFKKFLMDEIELLLSSGKVNELVKIAEEFKRASVLSPELQAAKQNLNETDFAKLVELMEKAKVSS
jgi:hypothetical protein